MARITNSEIERYYFKQFQQHFPLPAGSAEYKDKPDVRIRGDRLLGIEMASLYLVDGDDPASEQKQSKLREDVLHKAQSLHLAASGKRFELTVSFNPACPIDNVSVVAKSFVAVAKSIETFGRGPLPHRILERVPQASFIYYNPIEYPDARWRVCQPYTVPTLSVERVAELVTSKELRLSEYERCDAYWLLLVVDHMNSAQDQEIDWPHTRPALNTLFERIILYKPQFARWTEVPLVR